MWLSGSDLSPVKCQRQQPVRDQLDAAGEILLLRDELVGFVPVAGHVCELQVVQVGRVPAFGNRNDMVDAGRERMREFQPEVNRLAADSADLLRRVDFLLVRLELCPLRAVVVRPQVRAGSCSVRHGILLSGHG